MHLSLSAARARHMYNIQDDAEACHAPEDRVRSGIHAKQPLWHGRRAYVRRRSELYATPLHLRLTCVDVVVNGIALDLTTTNRQGARFGSAAIRHAPAIISRSNPWPWRFDLFARLVVIDYGNCALDFGRSGSCVPTIEQHARNLLETGVSMLTLGGGHFISYPLLRAHHEVHGPLALAHFDARSDVWTEQEKRCIFSYQRG